MISNFPHQKQEMKLTAKNLQQYVALYAIVYAKELLKAKKEIAELEAENMELKHKVHCFEDSDSYMIMFTCYHCGYGYCILCEGINSTYCNGCGKEFCDNCKEEIIFPCGYCEDNVCLYCEGESVCPGCQETFNECCPTIKHCSQTYHGEGCLEGCSSKYCVDSICDECWTECDVCLEYSCKFHTKNCAKCEITVCWSCNNLEKGCTEEYHKNKWKVIMY